MARALEEFTNEPPLDFAREEARSAMAGALAEMRARLPLLAGPIIAGKRLEMAGETEIRSPSDLNLLVGRCAMGGAAEANQAIGAAEQAFPTWSRAPAPERTSIFLRAADELRRRRLEFAALEVFECAKPWREADADVCEAIDFIHYYAREALRLSEPRPMQPQIPGERNDLSWHPLGVTAVIGPWNFPLAIPVGMMSAAALAGNTVVWKPAEQSPLVVALMMELLERAGLPAGVVNLLPGRGEDAGQTLLDSPRVRMVAFTGSKEVGLHILRACAGVPVGQPFVKRTVIEMGGKNAMIVDASADLDAALIDILASAFGYSGQKCSALSRLIAHEEIYDPLVERLREGAASLKIAPAWEPGCQLGPLIDAAARAKTEGYIGQGRAAERSIYVGEAGELAARGHFVAPAIFDGLPVEHPVVQEEIFGPVLVVLRARSFEEALAIANDTPYGLTGGVHSRTPAHLELARERFECGNLYLNRGTTGAIVGRQPFGGTKLSGIGAKTGGPEYLQQFMISRATSENLMRHGYAPIKGEVV